MRKSSVTRALAILLSMIMLLTGLPVPTYAESADMPVDTVDEQYGEILEEPDLPASETTETPVEDEPEAPTEDAAFPEGDTTPDDASGDDSAAGIDPAEEINGIPSDQPITEDMLEEEVTVEPLPEDESDIPDEPVVEEAPTLLSVANPSRFSGDEEVRLGKESSNINGIIVRKKGGSSNSIARHWVTVDGVEYTAYCIQVSKSATSGRNGGLEPSTDAGLLWILNHVPEGSDQDYAIKQQAIGESVVREGERQMIVIRFLFKILLAPFVLVLTAITFLLALLLAVSTRLLAIIASIGVTLSMLLFVTGDYHNGSIFLLLAWLISPLGLPLLAEWLWNGLDSFRGVLWRFVF